jgi:hypothetical protein
VQHFELAREKASVAGTSTSRPGEDEEFEVSSTQYRGALDVNQHCVHETWGNWKLSSDKQETKEDNEVERVSLIDRTATHDVN